MPTVALAPYVSLNDILNIARQKTNDAGGAQGLAGNILNNSQPYTITLADERYKYLQDRLISGGVETFCRYSYIKGIPPVASGVPPRVQVSITFQGYFNGQDINPAIVLPPSMLKPLELWECRSGGQFWTPMKAAPDSLALRAQSSRFGSWDFENDTLYLPGSTQTNDLKLKTITYAPALTSPTSPVMVLNCQTALAYLIAEDAVRMNGGVQMATMLHALAEDAIHQIINRTARADNYKSFQRRPFRGRRRGRNW
jgi:hypothetical protein